MDVIERISPFIIELHYRKTPLQDVPEELLVQNWQALMQLNKLVRMVVVHFKNKI
jgi:hypothetical protein